MYIPVDILKSQNCVIKEEMLNLTWEREREREKCQVLSIIFLNIVNIQYFCDFLSWKS